MISPHSRVVNKKQPFDTVFSATMSHSWHGPSSGQKFTKELIHNNRNCGFDRAPGNSVERNPFGQIMSAFL